MAIKGASKALKRRRRLSKALKANARAAMFDAIEIHNKPISKYRYEGRRSYEDAPMSEEVGGACWGTLIRLNCRNGESPMLYCLRIFRMTTSLSY